MHFRFIFAPYCGFSAINNFKQGGQVQPDKGGCQSPLISMMMMKESGLTGKI
jgi:hypothetical protein